MILGQNAPTASNVCLHICQTSHFRVGIPYAVDALVDLKRSGSSALPSRSTVLLGHGLNVQDRGAGQRGRGRFSKSVLLRFISADAIDVQGTANAVQGTRNFPPTSPHP